MGLGLTPGKNERGYWIGRKRRGKMFDTRLERDTRAALESVGRRVVGSTAQGSRVEWGKYAGEWALRPDFLVEGPDPAPVVVRCQGPHHGTRARRRNDDRQVEAYNAAGHRVVDVWWHGMRTAPMRRLVALEMDLVIEGYAQHAEVGL